MLLFISSALTLFKNLEGVFSTKNEIAKQGQFNAILHALLQQPATIKVDDSQVLAVLMQNKAKQCCSNIKSGPYISQQ